MSVKTVFAALVLATAAGAASAQGLNPGLVQQSNLLGVEPGSLSAVELSQLADAKRDNDTTTINAILSKAGVTKSSMGAASGNAGIAQIEAELRVAPGQLSPTELSRLTEARRDGDTTTEAAILSGATRAVSDASSLNAGKVQIAAQLGVNPTDYSLSQLVGMLPQADS